MDYYELEAAKQWKTTLEEIDLYTLSEKFFERTILNSEGNNTLNPSFNPNFKEITTVNTYHFAISKKYGKVKVFNIDRKGNKVNIEIPESMEGKEVSYKSLSIFPFEKLPKRNIYWAFSKDFENEWALDNIETMSEMGFRVFLDDVEDKVYFSTDIIYHSDEREYEKLWIILLMTIRHRE